MIYHMALIAAQKRNQRAANDKARFGNGDNARFGDEEYKRIDMDEMKAFRASKQPPQKHNDFV